MIGTKGRRTNKGGIAECNFDPAILIPHRAHKSEWDAEHKEFEQDISQIREQLMATIEKWYGEKMSRFL